MNYEAERMFYEAVMTGDTEAAIDHSQERGSKRAIALQQLPIFTKHDIPHEVYFKGVTGEMSYEERKKITDENTIAFVREQYERMGIKILSKEDSLFYNTELPEGWSIRHCDTYHNDILDHKGRIRAHYFYKSAFWDRDAFVGFDRRFKINIIPFDNYESDASYEERNAKPWYGVICDREKEIYRTEGVLQPKQYSQLDQWRKELFDQLEEKLKEKGYPDWENPHAYWEED